MPHVIEPASSGRAKCRGCSQPIAKGELRFGERQPNAFGDGEMTLWFHVRCAAYQRPEALLEAASADPSGAIDAALVTAARFGIEHRRVPRIHGAERATTSRARCRSCKEPIAQGDWRIAMAVVEKYGFNPGGFIHATCARGYFETTQIADRVAHFSPTLGTAELKELERALDAEATAAPEA